MVKLLQLRSPIIKRKSKRNFLNMRTDLQINLATVAHKLEEKDS
jgi:hypothetical protein